MQNRSRSVNTGASPWLYLQSEEKEEERERERERERVNVLRMRYFDHMPLRSKKIL